MQPRWSLGHGGSSSNVKQPRLQVELTRIVKLFEMKSLLHNRFALPPPWKSGGRPQPGTMVHEYHDLLFQLWRRREKLHEAVYELDHSSELAAIRLVLGHTSGSHHPRRPRLSLDDTGTLRFEDDGEVEKQHAHSRLLGFFNEIMKHKLAAESRGGQGVFSAPLGPSSASRKSVVITGECSRRRTTQEPTRRRKSEPFTKRPQTPSSSSSASGDSVFSESGLPPDMENITPFTSHQNSFDQSYGKRFESESVYPHFEAVRNLAYGIDFLPPSESHPVDCIGAEKSQTWGEEEQSQTWDGEYPSPADSRPPTPIAPSIIKPSTMTHTIRPRIFPEMASVQLPLPSPDTSVFEGEKTEEDDYEIHDPDETEELKTNQCRSEEGGIRPPGDFFEHTGPQSPVLDFSDLSQPAQFVHPWDVEKQSNLSPDQLSLASENYSIYSDSGDSFLNGVIEEYEHSADPRRFYSLPFWAQYESTRVALECNSKTTPSDIARELSSSPLFDQLNSSCRDPLGYVAWNKALALFGMNKKLRRFDKISPGLFASLERQGWGTTTHMSGEITSDFKVSPKNRFAISLQPLRTAQSNRYCRKYGSDRFLTLKLPEIGGSRDEFNKRVESVLGFIMNEQGIELIGRVWQALYVRPGLSDQSVIFFATRGEGIEDISIAEVVQWHIPLNTKNINSVIGKLYTRFQLAFTNSKATIVFKRSQICPGSEGRSDDEPYRPDKEHISPTGEVMDDGCSIASPAVFREIQQILRLKTAPTAVQARLGGAKGLWVVCPRTLEEESRNGQTDEKWIRVNESQYKYEEYQGAEVDDAWTTLDVVKYSFVPRKARTNRQIIPILEHCGVPYQAIQQLLAEHLDALLTELFDSLGNVTVLRNFLYSTGKVSSYRINSGEEECIGGLPDNDYEKLIMLLDSGFRHEETKYMKELLTRIMKQYWKGIREKTHINIQRSTTVFCVADPTGTLAEGEVCLQFSDGIYDERSKRNITHVEGDILVARNPAHLPSDIQKVKAVYNVALRGLQNVIVFSRQGNKPLASLLSGGDYDGDTCWVCWDERITQPFQNDTNIYPALVESNWFLPKETLRLRELPEAKIITDGNASLVRAFLWNGAKTAMTSSNNMLGQYCKIHERYTYQKGHAITDKIAIELAHICSLLVDAQKQGLFLKPDHKKILKARLIRGSKTRDYSDNPNNKPHYDSTGPWEGDEEPWHVLDKLHEFGRVKMEAEEVKFLAALEITPNVDEDLSRTWKEEEEMAREEKDSMKDGVQSELWQCLKKLQADLQDVQDKWKADVAEWKFKKDRASQQKTGALHWYTIFDDESDSFRTILRDSYTLYSQIVPWENSTTEPTHPIVKRWKRDAHRRDSDWELLKASCAFYKFGTSKFAWNMAAEQLCMLKARYVPNDTGGRRVIGKVLRTLKSDRRILEAAAEELQLEEEDEDDPELGFSLPVW
ncbi:RNA dependent RNA polymerase-domain-containing protein [Peziza echinospora]|nr:RNA dependent RNA polymerase-domain-containing protein [Peziza echinospora]